MDEEEKWIQEDISIPQPALLRTTTIQTKAFLQAPYDPLYNAALTT